MPSAQLHDKVGGDDCELPALRPGAASKRVAIEKLDVEMKKIAEALKQRGVHTALTDPKLMDQALAAYNPKMPLSPLHLNLQGRNLNGTKKASSTSSSADEGPSGPPTLVEKLDRVLLPSGLKLESLNARDIEHIASWQPQPWFGSRCRSPQAGSPRSGQPEVGSDGKLSAATSSKKPKLEPLQRPARERELEQGPGGGSRNPPMDRCASTCTHLPPLVHAQAAVSPQPHRLPEPRLRSLQAESF